MEAHTRNKSNAAELKVLTTEAASALTALAKQGGGDATAKNIFNDMEIEQEAGISTAGTGERGVPEAEADGVSSAIDSLRAAVTSVESGTVPGATSRDDCDTKSNKSAIKNEITGIKEEQVPESPDYSPFSSMADKIKDVVLRRLGRPEDLAKRNMFAVEGKSIKFPVKVRSWVFFY